MAATNQDDSVVFGTTNQPPAPASPGPSQNNQNQASEEGPKLSLTDLYGPSSDTPAPPPAEMPVPPPAEQPVPQQQMPPPQDTSAPGMATDVPPPPPPTDVPEIPPPPQPFPGGGGGMGISKMKFIFGGVGALILLLIVIGFIFSRGGGGGGGAATLTYWGLWEEPKVMEVIINDFEKKYPNIDVVYKKQDPKKYKDRIVTRITNNTTTDVPDIFMYHNSWLPTMTSVLSPLPNTVITPDEFQKAYYPVVQSDLVQNGAIYGLPQGIDSLSLYVNKEIFDSAGIQVPQTWDDFIKAGKALTVKDESRKIKTAGAALGTFDNIDHAPDIISLLMLQNGVDLQKISEHRTNVIDALIFYAQFARDKENVWDGELNPSITAFANGEVAMIFGYSWDTFTIKNINADLVYEVHPVPNLPGKQVTIASYWVNGVSNKSKHQKEAMLFMQHLGQKEVQQKLYTESSKTRDFGVPYARKDLAQSLKDNPSVHSFVQQADFASSTYFSSNTHDTGYSDKLNAYLGNAIRSILSGTSPDSAADTLMQGVQQVRSQYGL